MTKGSKRRHGRAEGARHVEAASRHLERGKYVDALKSMEAAARLIPDDAEVLGRFGHTLLLTGHIREAVVVLRRSIALRPEAAQVHEHLGIALQLLGNDESAIVSLREAVRLSPELGAAQGRLGEMLLQKGRRSEAALALERASAPRPSQSFREMDDSWCRDAKPPARYVDMRSVARPAR